MENSLVTWPQGKPMATYKQMHALYDKSFLSIYVDQN